MHWSARYVGTPWCDLGRSLDGADCYGLVWLVYLLELGIELPTYTGAYVSADERGEIAGLVAGAQVSGSWRPVIGRLEPFDLLLFRTGRHVSHIAVAVDRSRMLHMAGTDCAAIERWDAPQHVARLSGFWRHITL